VDCYTIHSAASTRCLPTSFTAATASTYCHTAGPACTSCTMLNLGDGLLPILGACAVRSRNTTACERYSTYALTPSWQPRYRIVLQNGYSTRRHAYTPYLWLLNTAVYRCGVVVLALLRGSSTLLPTPAAGCLPARCLLPLRHTTMWILGNRLLPHQAFLLRLTTWPRTPYPAQHTGVP